MNSSKIKAVILDLEQTLTSDDASWLQFTDLIGADSKVHQQIYENFKNGVLPYVEAKRQLIELWKKTGNANLSEIEKVFRTFDFRPGAIEAVIYLHNKYELCLISGSFDVFVESVAKRLDIKNYYASTKFIFDDQGRLIDLDYKLDRGAEKLEFLMDYCHETGIEPSGCAAIGDGETDMPIFERVGMPILFVAKETSKLPRERIKIHIKSWKDITNIL